MIDWATAAAALLFHFFLKFRAMFLLMWKIQIYGLASGYTLAIAFRKASS